MAKARLFRIYVCPECEHKFEWERVCPDCSGNPILVPTTCIPIADIRTLAEEFERNSSEIPSYFIQSFVDSLLQSLPSQSG